MPAPDVCCFCFPREPPLLTFLRLGAKLNWGPSNQHGSALTTTPPWYYINTIKTKQKNGLTFSDRLSTSPSALNTAVASMTIVSLTMPSDGNMLEESSNPPGLRFCKISIKHCCSDRSSIWNQDKVWNKHGRKKKPHIVIRNLKAIKEHWRWNMNFIKMNSWLTTRGLHTHYLAMRPQILVTKLIKKNNLFKTQRNP